MDMKMYVVCIILMWRYLGKNERKFYVYDLSRNMITCRIRFVRLSLLKDNNK